MSTWLMIIAGVLAAIPAWRYFDRLCLHLEAKGYLFYRHKQPSSGVGSSCILLQQLIEPSAKKIVEVADEPASGATDEAGDETRKKSLFANRHEDADYGEFNPQRSIFRSS